MKVITILALIVLITGCASPVTKNWGASGGSKADGTVELSVRHTHLEKPILSNTQGKNEALKRCENWGYSSVEEFDFVNTKCNRYDPYVGCMDTVITKKYQCQE